MYIMLDVGNLIIQINITAVDLVIVGHQRPAYEALLVPSPAYVTFIASLYFREVEIAIWPDLPHCFCFFVLTKYVHFSSLEETKSLQF